MVSRMTEVKTEIDVPLPESFDARDKWPGLIEKVMDQGNCGSSWAFSTTGTCIQVYRVNIEFGFRGHMRAEEGLKRFFMFSVVLYS